jgi:hypothetical protein
MSLVTIQHDEYTGDHVSVSQEATTVKIWQEASGLWSISAGIGAHKNIVSAIDASLVRELVHEDLCHRMALKATVSGRSFVFTR